MDQVHTASPSADSGFLSHPSTDNRKRKLVIEVFHQHDGSFDKENEPPAKVVNDSEAKGTPGEAAPRKPYLFPCMWGECSKGFEAINELYDHFLETHLQDEKERKEENSDDGEPLFCRWIKCKAVVQRGTWEKKVQFIEDHFHGRHAKKAQKFRCLMEDCCFRTTTRNMLENHIRSQHIAVKKEKVVDDKIQSGFKKWERFFWPNYPGSGPFGIGRSMDQKIQNEMCAIRDMGGNCVMQSRPIEVKGAARRKYRVRPNYVILPCSSKRASKTLEEELEQEADDSDEFDEVSNSYQSLTLDDLFPGYEKATEKKKRGKFVVERQNLDGCDFGENDNIPR